MDKKIIIVGQTGSGKDHLMRLIKDMGFMPCLKTTTRPIRKGEENKKTYNFITKKEFLTKIENGDLLVFDKFEVENTNGIRDEWYYGIEKENFYNSEISIMTPSEIESIKSEIDIDKDLVIYLDIAKNIRRKRVMNRLDNNDSVDRRIKSDLIDFSSFDHYNKKITNPFYKKEDLSFIKSWFNV